MGGWSILVSCGVCAWGVLMFLSFVANEMAQVREALNDLEERERKASQIRLQETEAGETVAEVAA